MFEPRSTNRALPSGYEGTSQSIFQAMAQAKPIAATNRGGIPPQIRDRKEGILLEHGNKEAPWDTILELLIDPELSASFSRDVREKEGRFLYSNLS